VLLDEVLVGEFVAVDRFAPRSVAPGEVAALTHEAGDDSVEGGSLVSEALLSGAKSAEILAGFGTNVRVQRHHDTPSWLAANSHIEEHLGFRHIQREKGRSNESVVKWQRRITLELDNFKQIETTQL